ncbi:MAG: DUF885 domain-containing protein [bacterium]|nr:DUF885 domain-containing protein [bacterium]
MRMRALVLCVVVLMAAACTTGDEAATTTAPSTTSTAAAPAEGSPDPPVTAPLTEFRRAIDAVTASVLALQPELVTDVGAGTVIGFEADYRLEDLSARGRRQLGEAAAAGLEILADLGGGGLSDQEQLSADVLRWYLEDLVAMAAYAEYDNPVNFITGVHANFPEFMADVHPIRTEDDAENYVERLSQYPTQIRDLIDRLEAAETSGLVSAETSLGVARWQIQNVIGNGDGESNPMVTDLRSRVEAMPDENPSWAAGLVARAAAVVEELIVPALLELDDAVRAIDGRSNQESGVLFQPGGDDYYTAVLRHYLSVDMTPEEVHHLGLEQVDRVVAELTVELDALGYDASADFGRAMRRASADAGAMPTTTQTEREAVLDRTNATIAEAASVFDEMFSLQPDSVLDVVRPRPGREGGSGAYYRSPPIDGSRNGLYYLSLGGAEFGVLTMDTTTYHEGIPGHHFQLALQRSMEELPLHQQVFDFTGYAEGWALYAERLAYEAGLYEDDPLGNIGRLSMELLRASRMVVDTGIHWAGWSRNDAVDYMLELGFDRSRVEPEVDRYVVWPGQAPAYMVGMLEILRLRDEATAELGEDFDLVGFHDALLSQGSVPVGLLETVVEQWIESVR